MPRPSKRAQQQALIGPQSVRCIRDSQRWHAIAACVAPVGVTGDRRSDHRRSARGHGGGFCYNPRLLITVSVTGHRIGLHAGPGVRSVLTSISVIKAVILQEAKKRIFLGGRRMPSGNFIWHAGHLKRVEQGLETVVDVAARRNQTPRRFRAKEKQFNPCNELVLRGHHRCKSIGTDVLDDAQSSFILLLEHFNERDQLVERTHAGLARGKRAVNPC